ncbi:MAG: hypothetical protein ACOYO1_04250 [Bacteroidales bacterium]
MRKKKVMVLILIILFVLSGFRLSAQDSIKKKAFISIHTGCYIPTANDFNKTYGSIIFINGLSIAFPISNHNLMLYGKAMFFKKEGTPIIYHFTSINGVSNTYTTQEGSVFISHYLFNLGFQYNILLKNHFQLITNAGLTFIKSNEKSDNPIAYSSNGSGFSGFFIGVGLERKFEKIPLSLFSECQYNSTLTILKVYNLDYSAINLSIGLRYYF